MCSEWERYEREVHLDVSPFEALGPSIPGEPTRIDHSRAVKKYHRPAAGNEAPLPEDVRPSPVLRRTMRYLVKLLDDTLAQDSSTSTFAQVQMFIRDRTRSIRQDATLQNLRVDGDSLAVHQEIARFHILSGHRLCELPVAEFDAFQNTEQLRKVLQSLAEFYTDIRRAPGLDEKIKSELLANEAEFRAYYLLTHLEDPDVFRKCFGWAPSVLSSTAVQLALAAGAAFHQHDYIRFFSILRSKPDAMPLGTFYLCCCLLHSHFAALRITAAQVITKAYAPGSILPTTKLADWLAFEDETELVDWCEACGFQPRRTDGAEFGPVVAVQKAATAEDAGPLRPRVSNRFVERLVAGIPASQLILQPESNAVASVIVPVQIQPLMPVPPPVHIPKRVEPIPLNTAPNFSTDFAIPKTVPPPVPAIAPLSVVPVPVPTPVAPVQPVLQPVKLTPQVVPSTTQKPSTLLLAQAMFSDLLNSVSRAKVDTIAQSVYACRSQVLSTSPLILTSLLDDLLLDLAKSSLTSFRDSRTKRVSSASNALLQDLLDREIRRLIDDAAGNAYQSALKAALTRKREAEVDPMEHAYEHGIRLNRPIKKLAQRPTVSTPLLMKPQSIAVDTRELQRLLEEERRETAHMDALLQSLLSKHP